MTRLMEIAEEAVRRIVEEAQPLRVVLFGSVAQGEAGPDSDLDLMVVMPDGVNRTETAYRLHRRFRGLDCSCDIVVVMDSEVEALKDNPNLIIHTALTTGKEMYSAAEVCAGKP